ncbi:hypothetical protein OG898_10070 [Streptomyces sp. NBC_00193]|uniref:hypothetical protein n=1 Tax=Streptomyces sp. NBC_00193 TaxID=2975675 RepID=UPI00224D9566|nr:hypothetical protein [Streptomyces sp. NBC_00193]MCX5296835.1 hypothetical protein [Streptomyces sp. NBC_00193]
MTATLASLNAPMQALRLFASEFPHLPAPAVSLSAVFPELLELSFHDDFAGFEAWREALGIAPETVSSHVHAHGRTRVLKVETAYAGAWLRLVGFAKVLDSEVERSRAEVAS